MRVPTCSVGELRSTQVGVEKCIQVCSR